MTQENQTTQKAQPKIDLRPDLWSGRLSNKDRELLIHVAEQYQLDPLVREIMVLQGNVYITAAGLQKIAIRDPSYNGCEVEIIHADWENNFYVVKARVWKKGCEYPFEDFGDADKATSKMKGRALFRHAVTRARARAMRSAFAVSLVSVEEMPDDWIDEAKAEEKRTKIAPQKVQSKKAIPAKKPEPVKVAPFDTKPFLDSIQGAENMEDLRKAWIAISKACPKAAIRGLEAAKDKKKAELTDSAKKSDSKEEAEANWKKANAFLRASMNERKLNDASVVRPVVLAMNGVSSRKELTAEKLHTIAGQIKAGPISTDSEASELFKRLLESAKLSKEQVVEARNEHIGVATSLWGKILVAEMFPFTESEI